MMEIIKTKLVDIRRWFYILYTSNIYYATGLQMVPVEKWKLFFGLEKEGKTTAGAAVCDLPLPSSSDGRNSL